MVEALKENTILKEAGKKDAEVLEDALNTNQVLIEEIRVKDALIEIGNEDNRSTEITEPNGVRCSICDWRSNNKSHLAGHMIKHKAGQYICQYCKTNFKTKQESKQHIDQVHTRQSEPQQAKLNCSKCDKVFQSEHSLKQHSNTKHIDVSQLPLGHPDQAKDKNRRSQVRNNTSYIVCGPCGKTFVRGEDFEVHMLEHIDESENSAFQEQNEARACRYFKRGTCTKGTQCRFTHSKQYSEYIPKCIKGPSCIYFKQNMCRFFHPGNGVQNPRNKSSTEQTYRNKACRYRTQCWNIDTTCKFTHPRTGFQFAQKTNRPSMSKSQVNAWMDY